MASRPLMFVLAGVLSVTLAACSDDSSPDSPEAGASSSGTVSSSPSPSNSPTPEVVAEPVTGQCSALTQAEAIAPTAPAAPPVPCARPHTSQTYRVGQLDLLRDGHLLAVDSTAATRQVQPRCQEALDGWLGGDARLSVLTSIWFTPSVEQSDAGSTWFRCDVIAPAAGDVLTRLPKSTKGLLASAEGRDTFGLCRTAAPSTAGSEPVPCSAKHAFRALAAVDLKGTTLPSPKAGHATLDSTCREAATKAADDPLDVSWQQELPTAEQWAAGRRYGLCWVPA